MESIITTIISSLSPSALPLVVVILGLFWIYRKTADIKKDREETKIQRDTDSQRLHDMVQKNTWEINNLKSQMTHHETLLTDINTQINILSTNIAILGEKIENLNTLLKEKYK